MWLPLLLHTLALFRLAFCHEHGHQGQAPIGKPTTRPPDDIPFSARAYWMRQAVLALGHPCPYAAFGTVIVNHTADSGLGKLVCTGANSRSGSGNPTLHGEIAAINNCTSILTSPSGPYALPPGSALAAFAQLTLYTTAESCPMCASAIRWAGFREYVYATSIDGLVARGWAQIRIPSAEVYARAADVPNPGAIVPGVLRNETDALFAWQNDGEAECPAGCERVTATDGCVAV
ncbi:hypothetical protein AAE478_006018 [Parahypoxylon ruwenzoriense]